MSTDKHGAVLAIVLASTAFFGCGPEIETPTWDPIDYTGMLDHLEHPTGIIVDESFEKTMAVLVDTLGVDLLSESRFPADLTILHNQAEPLLLSVENSDGGQANPQDSSTKHSVTGTSIFAEISCIGPDTSNPSTDFQYGTMHLEGPQFHLGDVINGDYSLDGDIYVEFIECHAGRLQLLGDCPGYLSDYRDHIAFDLDLTVVDETGEERLLDNQIFLSRDTISLLIDAPDYGTYVFALTPGLDNEFDLGTDQGFFHCSVDGAGLSCSEAQ